MGDFGNFVNQVAGMLGESLRIKKESKKNVLDEETKKWMEKALSAAEGGNVKAMFALGQAYYKGGKIAYDPEQAAYWWTEAGKRGDVDAQHNLGLLYHGKISPISFDPEKAGYWFARAAKNGDAESKEMLNKYYQYNDKKGKWQRKLD